MALVTLEELRREIENRLDEALIVEDPPRHAGNFAVYRDQDGDVVVEEQYGPRFTVLVLEEPLR